jgi:transketolase
MQSFGKSAPYSQLYSHFGITADRVVDEAKSSLADSAKWAGCVVGGNT